MPPRPAGWHRLSDSQQLDITRAALLCAMGVAARQAEVLAEELERGTLPERGGAEALRLFAAVLRLSGDEAPDLARLDVAGRA